MQHYKNSVIDRIINTKLKNMKAGLILDSAGTGTFKSTAYCVDYVIDSIKENRYKRITLVAPLKAHLEGYKKDLIDKYPQIKDRIMILGDTFTNLMIDRRYLTIKSNLFTEFTKANLAEKLDQLQRWCVIYDNDKYNNVVKDKLKDDIIKLKSEIKSISTGLYFHDMLNEMQIDNLNKIFPEILTDDIKVVIMTDKKYLSSFDSIITPYKFKSEDYYKNKDDEVGNIYYTVFDEMTKIYDDWKDICCDQRYSSEIDMIESIRCSYKALRSPQYEEPIFEKDMAYLNSKIQKWLNEYEALNNEYGIENALRIELEDGRIELFNSSNFSFFIETKEKKHTNYNIKIDNDNGTTTIYPCANEETNFNLKKFMYDVNNVFNKQIQLIQLMSSVYYDEKTSLKIDVTQDSTTKYAVENCTGTKLKVLYSYVRDYYIRLHSILHRDLNIFLTDFKKMVACSGVMLLTLENKAESNHTILAPNGRVSQTPENIIGYVSNLSACVCLSATQQLGGAFIMNNKYLKALVGDENYYEYSQEDFIESESCRKRDNNKIIVNYIEKYDISSIDALIASWASEYNITDPYITVSFFETLKQFIGKWKKRINNCLDLDIETDENTDDKSRQAQINIWEERLYKFIYIFILFLTTPMAKYGCYISNKMLNKIKADNLIYEEELYKIIDEFNILKEKMNLSINEEVKVYFITADEFKINDDKISTFQSIVQNEVNNGTKVLLITNREAFGLGINPQGKKDINFFYSEVATHVGDISCNNKKNQKRSSKEILLSLYNAKSLYDFKELSEIKLLNMIRSIIIPGYKIKFHYKDSYSYRIKQAEIFLQHMGRTTRRAEKYDYTFINVDSSHLSLLPILEEENYAKTIEIQEVIKVLKSKYNDTKQRASDYVTKVMKKTSDFNYEIGKYLSSFNNPKTPDDVLSNNINDYEYIRESIYQKGLFLYDEDLETIDKAILNLAYIEIDDSFRDAEGRFYGMYVKKQATKYSEEVVDISKTLNNTYYLDYTYESVMSNFKNNKFVDYRKNKYVLLPNAIDVYKGIVGEKICKDLLTDFDIPLEKLDDRDYEMLGDFVVKTKENLVFIDVKNYDSNGLIIDVNDNVKHKYEQIILPKYPSAKFIYLNTITNDCENTNQIYYNGKVLIVNGIVDSSGTPNIRAIQHLKGFIFN